MNINDFAVILIDAEIQEGQDEGKQERKQAKQDQQGDEVAVNRYGGGHFVS